MRPLEPKRLEELYDRLKDCFVKSIVTQLPFTAGFFETAVLDEAEGKMEAESVQRMARETGSQALLFTPIPVRVFESPTKSGDESSVMPSVVAVTPHVGAA